MSNRNTARFDTLLCFYQQSKLFLSIYRNVGSSMYEVNYNHVCLPGRIDDISPDS